MRTTATLLLIMLTSGCSLLGTRPVFTDLERLTPELLNRVSLCQMLEGDIDADGVYTNASAQGVSVLELNNGCHRVKALGNRSGTVEFTQ